MFMVGAGSVRFLLPTFSVFSLFRALNSARKSWGLAFRIHNGAWGYRGVGIVRWWTGEHDWHMFMFVMPLGAARVVSCICGEGIAGVDYEHCRALNKLHIAARTSCVLD